MAFQNAEDLMRALLAAKTNVDIRAILDAVGDHQNLGLNEPFGPFQFSWHPFGDNPSNISSIGLGTKPGRSLTERITNAIDAVLEDRTPPNVALPTSARAAAQKWFGRPISGPDDGLFKWDYSEHDHDRHFSIVISNSGNESAPTIDVIDGGIGISPENFPGTILSLQKGNKIQKWHLIGAFGQGGASTLSFCDYAIIISRQRDNPRVVGFTVIRVLELNETYKEDCYAYLCLRGIDGTVSVPSCQIREDDILPLYSDHPSAKVPQLNKGTVVRHISYQLPKLSGYLGPSPGNLYHYLHCSAFDPLLPFRLVDLRKEEVDNQIVTGSRNRLMKLEEWDSEKIETGTFIRYQREMEYFAPFGATAPCIGIELWVIFNYRKGRGEQRDQLILRPQSNEVYIQTGHPILGTLNGQNQGELTAQILRDLHLGMVARHIVIHVDTSRADSRIRRQLFSTDREGFKDGPVLSSLIQMLEKMLSEDETLYEIERELTEKLAKREAQSTSEAVKRQIVTLLQEAGLQLISEGPTHTPAAEGGEEKQPAKKGRKGKRVKRLPLPTLPFPQVTTFKIVYPEVKLSVHINDSETLLVHTDADSEFGRQQRLAVRSEPDCLELAGQSQLKGGRVYWRLRPRHTAKVSDMGKIVVSITKPDGSQLTDEVAFEVLPQREEKVKKTKGMVPQFDVIPINPTDDPEQWTAAWPNLDENATQDALAAVAYKPVSIGGGIVVYYSTIFAPYRSEMEKLKDEAAAMPTLFRNNYEVWVGYHAILQESARSDMPIIGDEHLEEILEKDRIRVAKMQVKQARSTAELMQKAMS